MRACICSLKRDFWKHKKTQEQILAFFYAFLEVPFGLPDLAVDLNDLFLGRCSGIGRGAVVHQGSNSHIVQRCQILGFGQLGTSLGDLGGDAISALRKWR